MEYIELNNRIECSIAGIGKFMIAPPDAENSVCEALNMIDPNIENHHQQTA